MRCLHAVGEVRARLAAEREKARLETDLAAAKRRNVLMDRVVQLAHGGAHSEVARAIMEALAEVAYARGAALYAAFDPQPRGECVRLASLGTVAGAAADAPRRGAPAPRDRARGAQVVPLGIAERLLALVLLEGGDPGRERDLAAIASLAATVLAFVDAGEVGPRGAARMTLDGRARVYSFGYLQDIAGREIEKAKRHGRRLASACILLDKESVAKARAELEQVVLGVVRDTDVLARFDDHEFYLLLPETGALGAHACRRRLLIRAEGDRRARTPASDRRGPVSMRPGRGVPLSIGVAAYPHDGAGLDRLLRAARQRADDGARSAVHTLGLAPMPLAEIIDVLLARPMMGAAFGSPYPLELVAPAMMSLVAAACREARRGGAREHPRDDALGNGDGLRGAPGRWWTGGERAARRRSKRRPLRERRGDRDQRRARRVGLLRTAGRRPLSRRPRGGPDPRRSRRPAARASKRDPLAMTTGSVPPRAFQPRVLLVEENVDELASLAAALRQRGIQVAPANGVSMACERAKTARVDVVIAASELSEARVDGLSLLDALAIELGQLPPVLLLVREGPGPLQGESIVRGDIVALVARVHALAAQRARRAARVRAPARPSTPARSRRSRSPTSWRRSGSTRRRGRSASRRLRERATSGSSTARSSTRSTCASRG